jgi:hypothetical protein
MSCGNMETSMQWPRRSTVVLLLLFAAASTASAELRYATVYRDHIVHGTTPATLYQDMIGHPIMDPDDGPAFANITHDHTLSVKTATSLAPARSLISASPGASSLRCPKQRRSRG